jgi:hypothetical protein
MTVEETLPSPKLMINDESNRVDASTRRTESSPSWTNLTCKGTLDDDPSSFQFGSNDTHTQSGLPTAGAKVTMGRPKSCACTTSNPSGTAAGSGGNANQNNAVALVRTVLDDLQEHEAKPI